uniref:Uncharacterized protein n=2 Tax=Fagus sylvatica TaxID=28930 RepID=A0A2N9GDT4_FAGSY
MDTWQSGENPNNWNLGAVPESSALKHKSGISLDWTLEEQAILEDGLANNEYCGGRREVMTGQSPLSGVELGNDEAENEDSDSVELEKSNVLLAPIYCLRLERAI